MTDKGLTIRQKAVLDFLKEFIARAGYPPSLREIALRFGIRSPKNAGKHLVALERKGFIRRSALLSRAIEVVEGATRNLVAVPVVGRVRAGAPHQAVEDIIGHVSLDAGFFRCVGAFILRVVGDSMIDAGIEDGDHVVVRPQKEASNGEIVVVLIDGEATVKRFFRDNGQITLKPANAAYSPIIVRDGAAEFSIAGKVVSVIKRFDD